MKIVSLLSSVFVWFCVATVLTQVALATVLVVKLGVTGEKVQQILTIVYGIDVASIREEIESARQPASSEQVAFDQVLEARLEEDLDLNLREDAVSNGLAELRGLESALKIERIRYKELKESFDNRLAELETKAGSEAILEVQLTLEAIKPSQAKDQIMRMLEDGEDDPTVMNDVITMFNNMNLDKRKKIIGEFKTEQEQERIYEVLKNILDGNVPQVSLMKETRRQLAQIGSTPG
jgi:hypothetical protein